MNTARVAFCRFSSLSMHAVAFIAAVFAVAPSRARAEFIPTELDRAYIVARYFYEIERAPGEIIATDGTQSVLLSHPMLSNPIDEYELPELGFDSLREKLTVGGTWRAKDWGLGLRMRSVVDGQTTGGSSFAGSIERVDSFQIVTGTGLPVNVNQLTYDTLIFNFALTAHLDATPANDGGFLGAVTELDAEFFVGYQGIPKKNSIFSLPLIGDGFTNFLSTTAFGFTGTIPSEGPMTFGIGFQGVIANGRGRVDLNSINSLILTAITFPDGTTPEQHGYTLQFFSGAESPNLIGTSNPVPEPASLAMMGMGAIVLCARSRRRSKNGRPRD